MAGGGDGEAERPGAGSQAEQGLNDLFKNLQGLGLSYRAGLTSCSAVHNYRELFTFAETAGPAWRRAEHYFFRCPALPDSPWTGPGAALRLGRHPRLLRRCHLLLLLILSDGHGVFHEGRERVTKAVMRARQAGYFVLFLVVEDPDNEDSVLDKEIYLKKFMSRIVLFLVE